MKKGMEESVAEEAFRLNAKISYLALIGNIAPLLGLLGTVWGMIQAFQVMALQKGIGKPELLAGGISQALVTTAAGLSVAIPVQVAYYWLKAKVDRFAAACEVTFDAVVVPRLDERDAAARRKDAA
jgi:biopolymer transport protein ExbB